MHWDPESEAITPQPDWQMLVSKYLQAGQWEDALMACEQVLETQPQEELAHQWRGTALYRMGRYEAAADSCDRVIALNPDNAEAWHLLGDALRHLDRSEEAISSYDRVLTLQPTAEIWYQRGDVLARMQRYDAAIASYDQALTTDPQNYHLWYQRGLLLRKVGHWPEAIASMDQALALQPTFYPATRSQLYNRIRTGTWWSALLHGHLNRELYHLFESIVQTKLPALVVLGLMAFAGGYSRTIALLIVGGMLMIVLAGDWITESRR